MTKVRIQTDGASRGNPGRAAIAYRIIGLTNEPIEFAQTIGQTTNNQAEYRALITALEKLIELDCRDGELKFIADSELMIRQLNGQYRVKNQLLKPVFTEAMNLIARLKSLRNQLEFTAVARSQNQRADELANLALDGKIKRGDIQTNP